MGRPYLVPLYRDDSRFMVIMKAVQVGISELLLCVLMSKVYKAWSVIYSMPTIDLRNDFIQDRFKRLLERVPFYRQGLKIYNQTIDNVGMKHFWGGTAWFVGSNSSTAFISRDADMGIVDEVDKSNQDNIAMLSDRYDASKYKYHWNAGNPSHTKYGIHELYLKSNRQEWHIVCAGCGLEQSLDFFKNVVKEITEHQYELIDREWHAGCDRDINVCCRNCHQPLDRLGPGRYIAGNPESEISGYHISQLTSPTKPVQEIYQHFIKAQGDETEMQLFFNSRLGLPYEGIGEKLTPAFLEDKCKDDYRMPSTAIDCSAGIDVGKVLHARVSRYDENKRIAVFIGTVPDFKALDRLLDRYNAKWVIIDKDPEHHKVEEYQRQNKTVWSCHYTATPDPDKINTSLVKAQELKKSKGLREISIDRTSIIDSYIADTLKGNNRIPKNFKTLDGGQYVDQMEAPTRILQETGKRKYYAWDEAGKPDHYFHADVYDFLASLIKDKIEATKPRYVTGEDFDEEKS